MMYGFARLKDWLQIIAAAQAAKSEVRYSFTAENWPKRNGGTATTSQNTNIKGNLCKIGERYSEYWCFGIKKYKRNIRNNL